MVVAGSDMAYTTEEGVLIVSGVDIPSVGCLKG